jgi:hypothetical protein
MRRSQSKEAIRLWFECLKRAQAAKIKINHRYYSGWGDWKAMTFAQWWPAVGQALFVRSRVELVGKVEADKDAVFARIPKSHTPTQAANELRRLLLAHYKESGHKPTLERSYALTEGKELKVVNVRAYLHTYDIHNELLSESETGKVSSTQLLEAMRIFYLKRTEKWKNSKRRVDGLPTALINGMAVNPVTGKRIAMEASDNSGALRAVRRYLTVADKLIANAAKGDWPGDYL